MNVLNNRTLFYCCENEVVAAISSIPSTEYYVTSNGRVVDFLDFVTSNPQSFFNFHIRCVGGKGGFSSLLRSFRVNKSTNTDMCRDLNGRRLGAVEKEKKIRTWIENQAEREKMVEEQRNQKIAKLKSKPVHEYKDAEEYEKKRRDIEDKTDTAFDDGISHFLNKKKEKKLCDPKSESDDSSDDDADMPGTSGFSIRKRKVCSSGNSSNEEVDLKREKIDEEEPQESIVVVEADNVKPQEPEITLIDERIVEESIVEAEEPIQIPKAETRKVEIDAPAKITNFDRIDLDGVISLEKLEAFGLDHLKHELEARSLKCGGTLTDRASRLFSVKGLNPEDYPPKIRAVPSKKNKK